ncbi:hypothetical protein Syun_020953 [Stephania yunnanensis]|uniref:Uncharacterized protein n=1 Tax=Stephania yunnanensis TaxID=152371 RepID=A0AAP0IEV5_9MAGN
MRSAVFVAIPAAVGNFLQGWDNATIAVFYLPESPRWLGSKGKMLEAKKVLQRICGREDVSGLLLVKRYVYHDVVRLDDLEKLID